MNNQLNNIEITFNLTPENNRSLANLCGEHDINLRQIERHFGVTIRNRGHQFQIKGKKSAVAAAQNCLRRLYTIKNLNQQELNLAMCASQQPATTKKDISLKTPRLVITSRTPNQQLYLQNILRHDINFGIGPAGTGKTYLAVAYAVHALEQELVSRIIIARPAVEAGERLGYLPGDIAQKVDPFLRPIYDALYAMLGFTQTTKLIETNIVEIAPLAFMRGRTLNDAIIILDEAQNTTIEQMKMFLTRIGFGSKAIITGDITQTDLPKSSRPGLKHATNVLNKIKEIGFTYFTGKDVVRHKLVQKIIAAYDALEDK